MPFGKGGCGSMMRRLMQRFFPGAGRERRRKVRMDYVADSLGVRNKILPFENDPRFEAAWAYTARHNDCAWPKGTPDVRWRAHTACWAAQQALTVDGDFVECGVYMGLLSLTICGYVDFDATGRRFWLFDTFSGIPERAGDTIADVANKSYTAGLEEAQRAFARFENASLVPGLLPGTLDALPRGRAIAYLSVDLNDSDYEMGVIDRLWDRVSPGGVVLIDDYGWLVHAAQYDAWNAFARKQNVAILGLPTGQGLIVKPIPAPAQAAI
jgi:O-methyltransferase